MKTSASSRAEAEAANTQVSALPAHKARGVGADIFGAARLALAKLVQPALNAADLTWYLDAGTLLGACRSGEQIAHDDDFDIAAYVPDFQNDDLEAIRRKNAATLPAPHETRVVTSYARKVEVFDSRSKTFLLPPAYQGADGQEEERRREGEEEIAGEGRPAGLSGLGRHAAVASEPSACERFSRTRLRLRITSLSAYPQAQNEIMSWWPSCSSRAPGNST